MDKDILGTLSQPPPFADAVALLLVLLPNVRGGKRDPLLPGRILHVSSSTSSLSLSLSHLHVTSPETPEDAERQNSPMRVVPIPALAAWPQ